MTKWHVNVPVVNQKYARAAGTLKISLVRRFDGEAHIYRVALFPGYLVQRTGYGHCVSRSGRCERLAELFSGQRHWQPYYCCLRMKAVPIRALKDQR
jgi:hypothetical protein